MTLAVPNTDSDPVFSQAEINYLQSLIGIIAAESAGYGVFFALTITAVNTLIHRGLGQSISRRVLLVAVLLLFVSSSLIYSATLVLVVDEMPLVPAIVASEQSSSSMRYTDSLHLRLGPAQLVCVAFNYFVSDAIVMWRAWMLSEGRFLRILLILAGLATLGMVTTGAILAYSPDYLDPASQFQLTNGVSAALFITNLFATCVIGYKTWKYRRNLDNSSESSTRVNKVLILLLESGALYAGIWLANGLLEALIPLQMISKIVVGMMPYISAIYPTAVIILVAQTMTDNTPVEGLEGEVAAHTIRFASARDVATLPHTRSIVQSIQSIAEHIRSNRSGPANDPLSRPDVGTEKEQQANALEKSEVESNHFDEKAVSL